MQVLCVAVCCSVLQCVAVCCSVLQCVAVCCRLLQCVDQRSDREDSIEEHRWKRFGFENRAFFRALKKCTYKNACIFKMQIEKLRF